MPWLLAVQLYATLNMTGLIWFVQIVHYPLFDGVGGAQFAEYSRRHQRWTTLVVGPLMLLEAGSATALVLRPPASSPLWMPWAGIGLLLLIWLVTAAVSVPAHGRLERGFDRRTHRVLVWTNWLRTVGWTLRSGVALAMIWPALASLGAAAPE
jgi:hypothetical protein